MIGRLLGLIPIVGVIMVLAFLLAALSPNDAADALAGSEATPQQIAELRARLNLDKPVHERFMAYVQQLAGGELGNSWANERPVATLLVQTAPVTASLCLATLLMALAVSLPAGILSALAKGGRVDRVIGAIAAFGAAVPPFVLALLLVILFAIRYPLFPAIGYAPLSAGFWPWLQHILLPAAALSVMVGANLTRQTRGALIDVLGQDYIRTKIASGLPRRIVVLNHGMKNAAIPVVTMLGLEISRLLGAVVVVEQIFNIPGIGSLGFNAVFNGDVPVIQGVVFVVGGVVLVTNLLVDVSYGYFSPKLLDGEAG